jgi:hypothetical protein
MDELFIPGQLRAGAFGEFVIYGNSYRKRNAPSKVVETWLLTIVNPWTQDHQETINDYWVCGEEFRRVVKGTLFEDGRLGSSIVHEDTPIEPPLAEKEAALMAMAAWEKLAENG